jgi:FdhE protein
LHRQKDTVVAGRIAKFLRRQTPEPPEVTEAVAQLARLAETQTDLRQAAALQSALLRAMYAAPVAVLPVAMTAEDAAARLNGGMPLLRNVSLPCEARHLRDTFLRLCEAATTVHTETGPGALDSAVYATLAEGAKQGGLDLWTLGNTWLTGDVQALPAQLEAQGYVADLVLTLLRLTLLPCLEHVATQLVPLRATQPWGRGYCPTCGAWPVLAEQRGLEQWRYLRCGLCASSWEVDRLFCPFCTTRDFHVLGYLQVEGEDPRQRVATCDACQSYLKLRSTLTPLTTPQLLVEEIALVHLDLIAMDKGYSPPL